MKNDPHEPIKRLSEFGKTDTLEDWFAEFNEQLGAVTLPPIRADGGPLPFVYIVGAPRSGTTLLSQVLSHCLELGYINNLVAKFWRRPSVGIRLSQSVLGDDPGRTLAFTSKYGTTEGAAGPHEFGYFWRHWLPLDSARTHHLTEQDLEKADGDGLRHAIEQEILAAFNKPVVTKNVICGFMAAYLSRLHPASLFIHIDRDPYTTACSILLARKMRYGTYDAWWSLKPAAWPFTAANPGEEVGLQVLHCRKEMTEELAKPGVNALHVTYEELCASPQSVIEKVQQALAAMGADAIQLRTLEKAFAPTPPPNVPQDLAEGIYRALHRFLALSAGA